MTVHDSVAPQLNPINRLYIMFLFTWQTLFRVSDFGMSILFAFILQLLKLLVRNFGLSAIKEMVEQLPHNVYTARKYFGGNIDRFIKYVSCPKCHEIYPMDNCKVVLPDKSIVSRTCSFVRFPTHPHTIRRRPCGMVLMKSVKTSCGTTSLYPRQMYCYKSVIESLKEVILRPRFIEKCEAWRSRNTASGTLGDIYDGQVWKKILNPGGIPFLSLPFNFALTLNVDWFQPFQNTAYSAGAIYLSIQNLPRDERYANGNVILVAVMPGPREPEKTMNSYLEPLVDELKQLWDGVIMQSITNTPVIVRAALICTACDIPASRKVSGFVGHNAFRACSRCLKSFPTATFGEKPDYTGFDRSVWPPRSNEVQRDYSQKHKKCNTASARKIIEREYGCRYSILLELPYYDVVTMCVVDPMHNLLLGTAKHMLSIWKSRGILVQSHFDVIQQKVNSFVTPHDVGRIPSRIASGFSGFTADQWRNWTILYSLCSLKDYLPPIDYYCWQLFVKACSLLCRRSITKKQLDEADTLLLDFCLNFEAIYGAECCTINIHLHGHLKECVMDFGPVYAFWLFSFERMNGILGSYHTNNHDISLQLMRRFLAGLDCGSCNWPQEFKAEFAPLIFKCPYNKGSLMSDTLELSLHNSSISIQPLPPITECAWLPHQMQSLLPVASNYVGHNDYSILTLHLKCKALSLGSFVIGSHKSRYTTSSHVMAKDPRNPSNSHLVRIEYFTRVDMHQIGESGSYCSFWVAVASLYFQHEKRDWFGCPTEVWGRSTMIDLQFIPIRHILSRVTFAEIEVDFGGSIGNSVQIRPGTAI